MSTIVLPRPEVVTPVQATHALTVLAETYPDRRNRRSFGSCFYTDPHTGEHCLIGQLFIDAWGIDLGERNEEIHYVAPYLRGNTAETLLFWQHLADGEGVYLPPTWSETASAALRDFPVGVTWSLHSQEVQPS